MKRYMSILVVLAISMLAWPFEALSEQISLKNLRSYAGAGSAPSVSSPSSDRSWIRSTPVERSQPQVVVKYRTRTKTVVRYKPVGVPSATLTYVVKAGDTLSKIAKLADTEPEVIEALNYKKIKNRNRISVGWELLVPDPSAADLAKDAAELRQALKEAEEEVKAANAARQVAETRLAEKESELAAVKKELANLKSSKSSTVEGSSESLSKRSDDQPVQYSGLSDAILKGVGLKDIIIVFLFCFFLGKKMPFRKAVTI